MFLTIEQDGKDVFKFFIPAFHTLTLPIWPCNPYWTLASFSLFLQLFLSIAVVLRSLIPNSVKNMCRLSLLMLYLILIYLLVLCTKIFPPAVQVLHFNSTLHFLYVAYRYSLRIFIFLTTSRAHLRRIFQIWSVYYSRKMFESFLSKATNIYSFTYSPDLSTVP